VFCGGSWLERGVIHKKGVFCGGSWLRRGVIHKKGVFCGGKFVGKKFFDNNKGWDNFWKKVFLMYAVAP